MNMIKDIGMLMMLGSMAVNTPAMLPDNNPQPETLSGYVQAAQDGSLKQDPVVTMVANLCPIISEAAEGEKSVYADQMKSACGLLQGAQSNDADLDTLLAMVE